MRNIKLILEYDGSRYQGWQRAGKNSNIGTISEKITSVIEEMTNEKIDLCCAARTEAGVHAHAQTINFKTNCSHTTSEMKTYMNHYLPQDIVIISAEDVSERFHSGLNAKEQTYLYRIQFGDFSDVFRRKYTYHQSKIPDLESMTNALQHFVGRHDFAPFSSGKKKKGTVKELYSLEIHQTEDEFQFLMKGNDFLHQMPRAIVSTLLDIGYGYRTAECIDNIFNKTETCSPPVPSCGLHLMKIQY